MSYTHFQTGTVVVDIRTTLRGTYLILNKQPEEKPGYELTVAISDEVLKRLKGIRPASERMP